MAKAKKAKKMNGRKKQGHATVSAKSRKNACEFC